MLVRAWTGSGYGAVGGVGAVKMAGADPDSQRRDLWEAIDQGHFPEWELSVQAFDQATADGQWHAENMREEQQLRRAGDCSVLLENRDTEGQHERGRGFRQPKLRTCMFHQWRQTSER